MAHTAFTVQTDSTATRYPLDFFLSVYSVPGGQGGHEGCPRGPRGKSTVSQGIKLILRVPQGVKGTFRGSEGIKGEVQGVP